MNHNKVIKFRVWRYCDQIKKPKFYYLNYAKIAQNGGADICFQEEDCSYYDDSVDDINKEDIIIQQFTGLKTKNGVEIYEGDIINCKSNRYVVEYNVSRAEYLGIGLFYSKPVYNLSVLDGFVMGNICETPELLKNL